MAYEFTIGSTRSGIAVPLCLAGPSFERSSGGGDTPLRVCRVPAGTGDTSSDHQRLRLLANRCAAPVCIAVGASCSASRGGNGSEAAGVGGPTMGRTRMGRRGTGERGQRACDGTGEGRV